MLFTTDKQTLEDLNIFGRYGADSVYNIFNHTVTRGGAALLEETFRYPLSDHDAINRRSSIIRHFAAAGTAYPFPAALFDAIAPYLDNTDERTRLSTEEQSISKKLAGMIAADGNMQMVYKGVQALIELLQGVQSFVSAEAGGAAYAADRKAIATLLSEHAFEPVLAHKGKAAHSTIAAFDVLFRFRYRALIQQLLHHLYCLDVYISVAKVATERGFVFPQALPRHTCRIDAEGVYHPLLKKAVPNNIRINEESNVIFLTGANMAGKSTFMKSLSIALFLAHMGFPVAAARMEFSVLDGIYTTINLPDNLGMGASHYYAEVLRVKKMAQELSQGKHLFIVFDELFRGTNVKDAYEATIAICKGFAGKRNSIFVISTHIIEAGEVLKAAAANIRFVYLPTHMDGHKPVYTYTLENGITDDRHGMIIINNEGIIDMLEAGLTKTT
ncbi:MutS-related protein [Chitinophaga filiformis]|uniref:DNA mismatch repair protein n=1 Tax=Chitinophaga filiformis TaxID=104663 RepID=A0ABY4HWV8_CHIFI|nr:DNA mismatch repair protein [Chitinophaga filiformis]UPK67890.1 DNA mismatch repair protein [Chitinophaga filiformis]